MFEEINYLRVREMLKKINLGTVLGFYDMLRFTVSRHDIHVWRASNFVSLDAEWTLYEQVAIAAMDCQSLDVAKVYSYSIYFPSKEQFKAFLFFVRIV